MASERPWKVRMLDAVDDEIVFVARRDMVLISVEVNPAVLDTPELRDEFARLYMEACRRADGDAPAAGVRGALPAVVGDGPAGDGRRVPAVQEAPAGGLPVLQGRPRPGHARP